MNRSPTRRFCGAVASLHNYVVRNTMSFDLPGVKPGSDLETLYKAIGFVVVQWGYAEQALDLLVADIFHRFKGHALLKRRPKQLEPKINFLRECFAIIPKLKSFQAEADPLLEKFLRIGQVRNTLVHSSIADFSLKDGAFMFLKVDVVPQATHEIRTVFLFDSGWQSLRKDLLDIGKDGQSLARRVSDSLK